MIPAAHNLAVLCLAERQLLLSLLVHFVCHQLHAHFLSNDATLRMTEACIQTSNIITRVDPCTMYCEVLSVLTPKRQKHKSNDPKPNTLNQKAHTNVAQP